MVCQTSSHSKARDVESHDLGLVLVLEVADVDSGVVRQSGNRLKKATVASLTTAIRNLRHLSCVLDDD